MSLQGRGPLLVSTAERHRVGEISQVIGAVEDDAELQAVFARVNGTSFADAKKQAFSIMRDQMADMLRDSGIELDLSELRHDMTPEEAEAALAQMKRTFAEQRQAAEEKSAASILRIYTELPREQAADLEAQIGSLLADGRYTPLHAYREPFRRDRAWARSPASPATGITDMFTDSPAALPRHRVGPDLRAGRSACIENS